MRQPRNRSYANRGATFERLIDRTNKKYRDAGIADVRKVPTPVKITGTNGRMVTGRKETAEWVDYAGVYKGRAIAFDAKETGETSFPLKNLSTHQYKLLESWHKKGAIVFLLVSMRKHDEMYLLPFEVLQIACEGAQNGGRKSIARETFENECQKVKSKDGYMVHYLDVLEV